MKIAIISDIHGNMQALDVVLRDISQEKCDKILCLGDLAMAGPEPVQAILKIKESFEAGKLDLIQGNTDLMIANYSTSVSEKVKNAFPIMGAALDDDAKLISDDLKTFLRNLPEQKQLEIENTKVLLVHGSPRKNDENIFPDMPLMDIEKMIENTSSDVIFCGHTHIPCGYQTTTRQTVINVGSVGRPFTSKPQACYVIADFNEQGFNVVHKLLDYDNKKAAEILSKRNFNGAEKLSTILVNPECRHM